MRAPEGTSLEATAIIAERIAREVREMPGVAVHARHHRRHRSDARRTSRRIYVQARRSRRSATLTQDEIMERVRARDRSRKQSKDAARRRSRRSPPSRAAARRRRSVRASAAPTSTSSPSYAQKVLDRAQEGAGRRRRRHDAHRRQARARACTIDREKAADLGVQVADIAATLRCWWAGSKVSTYEEKGEQYDVHVRAERALPRRRRRACRC